jgi:membrane protease YdiL (CAAX protease family)
MHDVMTNVGWRARADETFIVSMPSRARIVVEMALLVTLVFAGGFVMLLSPIVAAVIVALELVVAMLVVRPWSRAHGGIASRCVAVVLVVLAVAAPAAVERPSFAGESRRLGIGTEIGAREPGDPEGSGGVVGVKTVEPGAPADGVLRVGDRIVAIGGSSLDRTDPASDLARRTHGDDLPEDTTVTVLRDHHAIDLAVRIPKPRVAAHDFGKTIVAIREMSSRHLVTAAAMRGALLIALLLLVLRADGQPVSSLGLARAGLSKEIVASTWITFGAFATTILVAIPVGLVGMAAGVLEKESAQRTETLTMIASQGSILEFALAAIVAAAFEEIAFRGFLTPRMRSLVGSWPLAVVIVSMVFGLGHVYEGPLATVQTAFLGAYFAAMMLVRRRLVGPALAHAAFNTIMLIFVRVVSQTHVLERLKSMSVH